MKNSNKSNSRAKLPIRYNRQRVHDALRTRNGTKPRLGKTFPRQRPLPAFEQPLQHSSESNGHQLGNSPASTARSFPSWWIHLWSGIVRDPTAKHYKTMRRAIWLYLYLLLAANRQNGTLLRKIETIAAETGFTPRSINRWLKNLRHGGYIESISSGRSLRIAITKWRPISKYRGP